MSEVGDYVRHKQYGRIGRVVAVQSRNDVQVVECHDELNGGFYPGPSLWFRENIEPSSREDWVAYDAKVRRHREELKRWAEKQSGRT